MGGGGNSGTQRYAEYVEDAHETLIRIGDITQGSILTAGTTSEFSPYASITVADPDDAFFGSGNAITDSTSMFELFAEYITDTDVDALYETILNSMVNSATIDLDVAAEVAMLDAEINDVSLPKIQAGYRDINAVMSTGFILATSNLESKKLLAINKYKSSLKLHAMSQAIDRWSKTLEWNVQVMEVYMRINQLYWAAHHDYVETSTEISAKNYMWPFTILDAQRALVAALQGSAIVPTASKASKAITGALGGAAAGAFIGGGLAGAAKGSTLGVPGAVIGGLLGLAGGLLS